ncbi:MAG: alpha/beta fold hydrolase [Mariprofundaceae bacterium]|nr:alpha/beta fold hydrolase [Mariprofundaceae bacterium]
MFFSGWGFQACVGDGLTGVEESVDFLHQASFMMQAKEKPTVIVGWSLGGQAAIRFSLRYPEQISGLVLMASSPCFCAKESWLHGCSQAWFDAFYQAVQIDPEIALKRFNQLMLHGGKMTGLQRRQYLQMMHKSLILEKQQLLQGLQMLHQQDLREELHAIHVPVLLIHGENDQVIPCQASDWMAQEIPHAQQHMIRACGHAPLWTHSQQVNEAMENWCQQII